METVVRLAIERMSEEIERFKQTVGEQQKRISELERNRNRSTTIVEPSTLIHLVTTKKVTSKLGSL